MRLSWLFVCFLLLVATATVVMAQQLTKSDDHVGLCPAADGREGGEMYYIVVDGYGGDCGTYNL